MDEPPLPLVTTSMERLNELIEKAEPLLQAGLQPADLLAKASEPFLAPQPVITESDPVVTTKS
jgi:hypothetical protein